MEPRVQASDFEALVRETCAPQAFVGHRSEKQALYKWMDRTYEKNQSLLFLVGPTGSGKTRLTRAAIARAKRRKNVVCTGICRPAGGPYAPFAGALLEAVTGASPRSVRVRLENCLAEHPKLAELIGHRGATTGRPVNTEMGRDALFRTLAHALLLLASEGPALLVVEDLHLADASTLEFFRYFAPRTRVHRLQMLSTCRTVAEGGLPCFVQTLLDDLHRSCGAARITLGGLTPQDTDALIRSVYRKNLFSQELRRGLHRGSSGNPSIILDALRLFRDQGVIYQEAGVWRERRVPTESNTPFELYETVAHRLEQLNPDVVQFLRLAAVCGPTFNPTVIEHAL
ncbi:MAG: AAA family ATPase, partial [bacterium]|nr:AAA family ATPase [bacterium]